MNTTIILAIVALTDLAGAFFYTKKNKNKCNSESASPIVVKPKEYCGYTLKLAGPHGFEP